ncbi:class A sortase [Lentilactobacillus kefiri]|nr:class A sortase [Lentilactobacillus kefiri]KRL53555.1 sortase family protein [Lentilactobacillus parakefiri DSM 10551]MCJ2161523.1 class A sortase [Lentilactobacillus kefiri]MCP9368984.1 class A sortase [Lentilactobacillus kefiri]MDH5108279.1 class A sortase [Lentilactobacillus kefiri]MDM7492522.1 class A sortase [Lentilactobacillus kefiri]
MRKGFLKKLLINIVFVLLIIVALGLIFNRQIKNELIKSYHPTITRKTVVQAERRAKKQTPRHKKNVSYNFKKVKSLDFQTAAEARMNTNRLEVIGEVLLPKSHIHLPIGLGVANTTLALAAGTMRADQQMGKGNYPLAGHHMVNPNVLFGPLYFKTKVDDHVYLSNMKRVYQYKVYQRTFIAATRVDVVRQTKQPIVTLVTCDATGAGRLMIRGKFQKSYRLTKATPKLKRALLGPVNN